MQKSRGKVLTEPFDPSVLPTCRPARPKTCRATKGSEREEEKGKRGRGREPVTARRPSCDARGKGEKRTGGRGKEGEGEQRQGSPGHENPQRGEGAEEGGRKGEPHGRDRTETSVENYATVASVIQTAAKNGQAPPSRSSGSLRPLRRHSIIVSTIIGRWSG